MGCRRMKYDATFLGLFIIAVIGTEYLLPAIILAFIFGYHMRQWGEGTCLNNSNYEVE